MKKLLVLLFLCCGLGACSFHEDADDCCCCDTDTMPDSYITVSLSVAEKTLTRETPLGGDYGDGTEAASNNEGVAYDVTLFLYQINEDGTDPILDDDATAATVIVSHAYYFDGLTEENEGEYTTGLRQLSYLDTPGDGTYCVLAVVNGGDLTEYENMTLAEVRDIVLDEAWTEGETIDQCDRFVMTSTKTSTLTLNFEEVIAGTNGTLTRPFTVNVTVQRLAARVDYRTVSDVFDVTDNSGDQAEILGALVVNDYNPGTYLIKRTADTPTGSVTYYGTETVDANSVATNYVIDPYTRYKTTEEYVGTIGSRYYKLYYSLAVENNSQADWDNAVTTGVAVADDAGTVWQCIGYTQENTALYGLDPDNYNTGMIFAVKYTPATVTDDYLTDNYSTEYAEGGTFFMMSVSETETMFFGSLEDIVEALYASEGAISALNSYINSFTSWDDLEASLEGRATSSSVIISGDVLGYATWLLAEVEAGVADGTTFSASNLTWEAFVADEYGYSISNGAVAVSADAVDNARTKLHQLGIYLYYNSECYYTHWLQHSANSETMLYGVVRNNIYKVEIAGVEGIGDDIPGGGASLQIRAYAVDWNLLASEEFEL